RGRRLHRRWRNWLGFFRGKRARRAIRLSSFQEGTARASLGGLVAGYPPRCLAPLTFHQVSGGGRDRFLIRHDQMSCWLSLCRLRYLERNVAALLDDGL